MEKDYIILIPSFNSLQNEIEKTLASTPLEANILIVDDGSAIPFQDTYIKCSIKRENLSILRLDKNVGIETALKLGVESAAKEYKYIARLDIGDDGNENRFQICKDFLNNNKDIVLVGTWARFVNTEGNQLFIHRPDIDDKNIRKKMFINNIFVHPSVMMRTDSVLKAGNYSNKYPACEDYDLFFRLMKFGKVANIDMPLVNYTVDYNSISSKKRKKQIINRIKIIINNFTLFRNGVYPYYGLLRNIAMLLVSRKLSTLLRKVRRG
ncbi:TPA: glycosyltransferase [Klebsiella quasipneumoniae]|uniref:glycosyltransferase n=1 Tax=Klebsiella quasipneumoniae TaxID=1463165 RepID=UPI000B95C6C8|nr:glycosyltransferase [Klebsiella quasipneumoniae]HDZ2592338.1 glycosyltransferase [Klebsiella pneumoniae]QPV88640.1 glycosyltransferase [Klebsiella quasipneumoniae]TNJ78412.1 glycosyltransferase [Klebsiella quasipneumoniae subsp. similipneumoniae]SXD43423.1 family 2 glycosyl transferase [Klebsiella quasipneumoniae]VGB36816.1 family 2 glycosyl transferase [Klebsiella quasipneumoniae]